MRDCLPAGCRPWIALAVLVAACAAPEGPDSAAPAAPLWHEDTNWHRSGDTWVRGVALDAAGRSLGPATSREFEAIAFPTAEGSTIEIVVDGRRTRRSLRSPSEVRVPLDPAAATRIGGAGVVLHRPRLVDPGEARSMPAASPRRRLLVVADALRADHVDASTMPEVWRYFSPGLHFERAYATATWTLPLGRLAADR